MSAISGHGHQELAASSFPIYPTAYNSPKDYRNCQSPIHFPPDAVGTGQSPRPVPDYPSVYMRSNEYKPQDYALVIGMLLYVVCNITGLILFALWWRG